MDKRYIGFKTFLEMEDFKQKLKEEDKNINFGGSGWSKENKHFFEVLK